MRKPTRVEAIRAYVCDTGMDRAYVFTVVETDSGVCGYGEASQSGQDDAVLATIAQLAPAYVGCDLFELIERRAQIGRSDRSGRATIVASSGLEIALWDAIGKVLDVAVYQLLGGSCRASLPCYATISAGVTDWTPKGLADEAEQANAEGFTAVKVVPFAELPSECAGDQRIVAGAERVAAVRKAVGDNVDIMIECAFSLDPVTAARAADALSPFHPFWLEAPLPWDDAVHLADLRRKTSIRIASGELFHGARSYRELIEARAVDVLQPDVKWVGGILEAKKVAAWADAYQLAIAPHNNSGPIGTAASAHLAMTLPNALTLEVAAHQPAWVEELTRGTSPISEGTVTVDALASRPGLGLDIDESVAKDPALATFAT